MKFSERNRSAALDSVTALSLHIGRNITGVPLSMITHMSPKLLTLLTATLPFATIAQINYNGGTYIQDFDSLQSGSIYTHYTNFPTGWTVSSTYNSGVYVWTTVTNGYSNNYGKYCFSLKPGDPDKAIGLVIGTTGPAYLGARFRNTSGVTLTTFSLTYFAEQWSKGAVVAATSRFHFPTALTPRTSLPGPSSMCPPSTCTASTTATASPRP